MPIGASPALSLPPPLPGQFIVRTEDESEPNPGRRGALSAAALLYLELDSRRGWKPVEERRPPSR